MNRFVPVLVLLAVAGCGGGDSTQSKGSGGASGSGASAGDSAVGSGGASGSSGSGGATSSSGGSSASSGGGSSGASTSGGASGTGGALVDGGPDASSGGTTGSGGTATTGGTTGSGGTATTGGTTGSGGTTGKQPNGNDCGTGTDCTSGNCVGGACCALPCNTPGVCEKQDGTVCVNGTTCNYGKAADNSACDDGDACTTNSCFEGSCVVNSNKDCSDTSACTTDSCDSTTGACSHVTISCDDNNPCTKDNCDATLGCQHSDDNTQKCTDGDPCTVDACTGGVCVSTAMDCSGKTDDCNVGVCSGGTCAAQPTNNNGACADGLTACDATGVCNATGTCVGADDACGALAATCAACTGTTNCFNGRRCTCTTSTPPNIVENGVCVPDTDECDGNPCSPLATCKDPTPAAPPANDYVCTCPKGYSGNGKGANGCVDINECAGGNNPCGSGVATNGCNGLSPPGSYSCTCAAGYTSIPGTTGPTCACDLSGTYALVSKNTVAWKAISVGSITGVEPSPPGGVATYSYALRYQTTNSDGSLTVQSIPCGGTSPDLCDTFFGFAHAQYQPNQTWGKPKVDSGFPNAKASLKGVVPGGTYTEPTTYALSGIALANPAGAWPPCEECVGVAAGSTCMCPGATTAYTVTNKATWVDSDADGKLGDTTTDVPRGGVSIGQTPLDPPYDYVEPSECPRLASSGTPGTYTYAEWPGAAGIVPFRTYRWYGASRLISGLSGTTITFANNACGISGNLTGPDTGKPHADSRVEGCETCSPANGNGCTPGSACTTAQVDTFDSASTGNSVISDTFTLTKSTSIDLGPILAMTEGTAKDAALNQACEELRTSACPPGKTCK